MARQVVEKETKPGQTRKLARILATVQGLAAVEAGTGARG
jgi:hypothetical protein